MNLETPHILLTTAPDYPEAGDILREIAAGRLPRGAECIYEGSRNRLYRFPSPLGDVVVKCFRRPNLINSVAYTTVRRSKACRSFLNSLALRRVGVPAPKPLAYAEERSGLRLGKSYYLSRAVEGDTIRFYEMRPDCDAMLSRLARCMLQMHLLGIRHKDFSPGNVIVNREDNGTDYTFHYVDLNRMSLDDTDHQAQIRMFERINYSEMHTKRLARAYASLLPERVDSLDKVRTRIAQRLTTLFSDVPDPLEGLYPLLRTDIMLRRGEEWIVEQAVKAFRSFWHARQRKSRLKHPLR